MANSGSHGTGTDLKIAEKASRSEMKAICSLLYSLVPHQNSAEATPLPDQLKEATNYIKELQKNVEKLEKKRDRLKKMKSPNNGESKPAQIKVGQAGSIVKVIMVTGLDYHFMFRETIRIVQEEGAKFLNSTQSVVADSVAHSIFAEVTGNESAATSTAAARISERLKNAFSNAKIA